jgi:hypothetical protein
VTQLTRALHCAKVINYLHTILQHLHLKQRRMVLPGEDEDEDEGIGPSVGRRIFSSSSSFQSLPLCSCVSFCWVYFFYLLSTFLFCSFSLLSFFLFSAPFSHPQSSIFIGDVSSLLFAHGLPLDKHGWEGCVGVSLGFEYLSSILISPGH